MYDNINRSGLIQARLRAIHKNLKTSTTPPSRKRTLTDIGGPNPKSAKPIIEDQLDGDDLQTKIDELNGLCAKEGIEGIKTLMAETLSHRNQLRSSNNTSILKLYRKFTECDYLVSSN